jgi:ComF family protein
MPQPLSRLALGCAAVVARWRAGLSSDCPVCGARARGGMLCAACEHHITWQARTDASQGMPWRCATCALPLAAHDTPCPDCDGRDTAFDRTVIAFDYAPPADALILQMKNGRSLARADMLGNLLAEAVRHQSAPLPHGTLLVPIPASRASLRARGFNPAAEIARALARDLGLPTRNDLLWRTREQPKQSTLGRLARQESAQGLYACAPEVSGKRFALVDDVITTGSTMHEAAKALKQSGAAHVVALAVGRTPQPPRNPSRRPAIRPDCVE